MHNGKLVVVGLGYVGLPLAVLAKEKGWDVTGYDISAEKVRLINAGTSPLKDDALQTGLRQYPVPASTSPEAVATADVIVIAVPTPVTGTHLPDLGPLEGAVKNILPYLKNNQLLVVESTINPGVMDEVVLPILQTRPDVQLDVVHCPERINPGDKKWSVRNIPRVVGGYTPAGVQKAKAFYESVIEAPIMPMGSISEAEAVKILENTFRDVNIAFINEMAKSFAKLDIDILNVIRGAATKPFAFMPHFPGNGVGGHCISVDPYYMIERGRQAGFDHEFLKLAREINNSMPAFTVGLLHEGLKQLKLDPKKQTIAFLGVTYKKNIDDTRESPAIVIRELLEKEGFTLHVWDPYVPAMSTVHTLEEALAGASVVMLAADHTDIVQTLTPECLHHAGIKLVIDGKNALDADGIAARGIRYTGIGHARS
jgi:UDP-N-acetyl-D-glucosamine dehydrogenase